MSRTPGVTTAEQPDNEPGQHTEEVLAEMGYSKEDIAKFAASGAITFVGSKL